MLQVKDCHGEKALNSTTCPKKVSLMLDLNLCRMIEEFRGKSEMLTPVLTAVINADGNK